MGITHTGMMGSDMAFSIENYYAMPETFWDSVFEMKYGVAYVVQHEGDVPRMIDGNYRVKTDPFYAIPFEAIGYAHMRRIVNSLLWLYNTPKNVQFNGFFVDHVGSVLEVRGGS